MTGKTILAKDIIAGVRFYEYVTGVPTPYKVVAVCDRGKCVHATERDRYTVHLRSLDERDAQWFTAFHDDETLHLIQPGDNSLDLVRINY